MPRLRSLVIIAAAIICFYGAATAALYVAMVQPPERFGAIMSHVPMPAMMVLPFQPLWMSARGGVLHEGDMAPDFFLPTLDRSRTVRLSTEVRERPVVLIFGSYS